MKQPTDRLLTNIGLYFRQKNSYSFILVTKRFAHVGKDFLHKRPIVPPPTPTKRTDQIANFLRIILTTPSIASQAPNLELYPRLQDDFTSKLRQAPIDATILFPSAPYHFGGIVQNASVWILEYELAGFILRDLPNLENLRFELVSPQYSLKPTIHKFCLAS